MNDRIPGATYDNPIWFRDKWRLYLNDTYPEDWRVTWFYIHDDYDGAPDGNDSRYGYAATEADCKQEIHDRFYSGDGK